MTYSMLKKILDGNHIPDDAVLMSDSGWECDATDIGGVYYNPIMNCVVFTQNKRSDYNSEHWKLLYSENKI